ncbi:MAG: tripartite tricarboxylate transporter TctB family protein [Bacillota bacterium]
MLGRYRAAEHLGEVAFLIALCVLQGAFIRESLTFEPVSRRFPLLFATAGCVLSAVLLGVKLARPTGATEPSDRAAEGVAWYVVSLCMAGCLLVAYVFGFLPAIGLFAFLLPGVLGERKVRMRLAYAVVVTALFWAFGYAMSIPLPEGHLARLILGGSR